MTLELKKKVFSRAAGFAAALCLIAGTPAPGFARRNGDATTIQRANVLVPKGETLNEDVVTSGAIDVEGVVNGDCVSLGGPVTVAGEVRGDVASMGGAVVISGKVKGDVAALGGDVDLRPTAAVAGSVALLGGKLHQAPGASVRDGVTNLDIGFAKRFLPLFSHYEVNVEMPKVAEKLSLMAKIVGYAAFVAFIGGIGLMILLLTILLPRHVEAASEAIKSDFWRSAGAGVLILTLTLPGLIMLVISILGIPLVPLTVLLYCVAVLMGLAAFSLILTERFYAALGRPAPSNALARVGAGYLLLTGLLIVGKVMKLTGSIGGLLGGIFILTNMIMISCGILVGLGAVWTTRLGSRKITAQ